MNESTLQFGSIVRVKIVHVKKDYTDLTFSIPINILTAMGADFDGDQMNTYGLKDLYLKKAYASHDPRENMIISKNDGLFDDSFNLIKDQLICFHQFNKLCNDGIEILKSPTDMKESDYVPKESKVEKQKIKIVKVRRIK